MYMYTNALQDLGWMMLAVEYLYVGSCGEELPLAMKPNATGILSVANGICIFYNMCSLLSASDFRIQPRAALQLSTALTVLVNLTATVTPGYNHRFGYGKMCGYSELWFYAV